MQIRSQLNKSQSSVSSQPDLAKTKILTVPDEIQSSISQEIPDPQQQELSREEFFEFRKNISKQKQEENNLTEQEKQYLEALLGFGIAEKEVKLNFKGTQLTFTLQSFNDKLQQQFVEDKLQLEYKFKQLFKHNSQELDTIQLNAKFLIEQRKVYLKHAIAKIHIGSPINKFFTTSQITSFLNLEKFEDALETWGDKILMKLFEAFQELNNELESELFDTVKLTENLKK